MLPLRFTTPALHAMESSIHGGTEYGVTGIVLVLMEFFEDAVS